MITLKDLVVLDNFPALHKDGKHWVEGQEPIPSRPFLSFGNAMDTCSEEVLRSLQKDCETVFTARTKESDKEAYSLGTTYFLPCTMKPRCALEALAEAIFQQHTKNLPANTFLKEQSGAEWWTLVMNSEAPIVEQGTEEDMDDEDEVGLHFDADYGLEDQHSILLHPRLATITYLSDVGAPTLILDRSSPTAQDDDSQLRKQLGGEIRNGWISGPKCGKHVAFDGRLLHGAPATFFPGAAPKTAEPPLKKQKAEEGKVGGGQQAPVQQKKRITFLVNIWLNHCPLDPEPLESGVIEQLKTPWNRNLGGKSTGDSDDMLDISRLSLETPDETLETKTLCPYEEDPAGSEDTVLFSREVTLFYNSKMEAQHEISLAATKEGKSYQVEFQEGALKLEVGRAIQEETKEEEE